MSGKYSEVPEILSATCKFVILALGINPLVPNAPVFHPLKTLENLRVEVERGCIGNEWVEKFRMRQVFKSPKKYYIMNNENILHGSGDLNTAL